MDTATGVILCTVPCTSTPSMNRSRKPSWLEPLAAVSRGTSGTSICCAAGGSTLNAPHLTAEQVEGSKLPTASDGQHVEGCESDSEAFCVCKNSKRDTYQDFMPIYQQLCKSTSAPGELGEKFNGIMKKGLKS